ncbi:MAG: hypothetical protein WBB21_05350 [Saprospiraceae bacterium]
MPVHNRTFAIAWVSCSADSFVVIERLKLISYYYLTQASLTTNDEKEKNECTTSIWQYGG